MITGISLPDDFGFDEEDGGDYFSKAESCNAGKKRAAASTESVEKEGDRMEECKIRNSCDSRLGGKCNMAAGWWGGRQQVS